MKRSLSTHLLALSLITAVVAVLWVHRIYVDRPARQGKLGSSDMVRYFYPDAIYLNQQLRRAHVPLWNPYQMAGVPFLALHTPGTLYPPNLLLMAALPPARALEAHAIVHLIIAAFFTWILATRLGIRPAAALGAAAAFVLSAEVFFRIYNVAYLSTLVWLPAILWAVNGLLRAPRLRWAVALAATLTLAFLGGFSQGFIYEVQLAAVYGTIGIFMVTPSGRRLRVIGYALFSAVLVMGLSAAQLLPTLELVTRGTRTLHGLTLDESARWAVPIHKLLRGVLGTFHPTALGTTHGGGAGRPMLAVLTLPLVLVGIVNHKLRYHWTFFLATAVVTALIMAGLQTPVFAAYWSLPLGSAFRLPVRIAFVYTFAAAMLIGIGIQGVSCLIENRSQMKRAAGIMATALSLLVAGDFYARSSLRFSHPVLTPRHSYAPRPLIDYLRRSGGLWRVFLEDRGAILSTALQYKMGMMNGLFVVPDYEPLLPDAYRGYFRQDTLWHGRLNAVGPRTSMPAPVLTRLLDLMSVRYYAQLSHGARGEGASREKSELASFTAGVEIPLDAVDLFERPTALPRAFVVHRTIRARDETRAFALITMPDLDPHEVAVVTKDGPQLSGPPSVQGDDVAIVSYSSREVGLRARCSTPCLAVLTDLQYPGWEARVDGRPVAVHRVNGIFRGVRLDPGEHRIVYRYRPWSVRAGAWISLATILGLALVGTCGSLRRRTVRGSRTLASPR